AGRTEAGRGAIEAGHAPTGDVTVAIAKIELQPRPEIVGDARRERIGEPEGGPSRVPAGSDQAGPRAIIRSTGAEAACIESAPLDAAGAQPCPDIGREAGKGAKIAIDIGQHAVGDRLCLDLRGTDAGG